MSVPWGNQFEWTTSDIEGTRPAAAMGATVTPAENAKGSYAQVLTAIARDAYLIDVCINANAVATDGRDTIVDIGVDPAGGTTYSILIPDLLGSCASSLQLGCGIVYTFPIWIRAGSTVAARASVNFPTVGTLRVSCRVYGSPRDSRLVKVGTFVTSFGITAATSNGTAVTSGTTAEGAWTQLGSATARELWFWQCGMGVKDDTMNALNYFMELGIGDATNKKIVIPDVNASTTNGELLTYVNPGAYHHSKIGDLVYGRLQCSGTADAGVSMAAWGVGG